MKNKKCRSRYASVQISSKFDAGRGHGFLINYSQNTCFYEWIFIMYYLCSLFKCSVNQSVKVSRSYYLGFSDIWNAIKLYIHMLNTWIKLSVWLSAFIMYFQIKVYSIILHNMYIFLFQSWFSTRNKDAKLVLITMWNIYKIELSL